MYTTLIQYNIIQHLYNTILIIIITKPMEGQSLNYAWLQQHLYISWNLHEIHNCAFLDGRNKMMATLIYARIYRKAFIIRCLLRWRKLRCVFKQTTSVLENRKTCHTLMYIYYATAGMDILSVSDPPLPYLFRRNWGDLLDPELFSKLSICLNM